MCLSVRDHNSARPTCSNFIKMLHVRVRTVARSSSGGVSIMFYRTYSGFMRDLTSAHTGKEYRRRERAYTHTDSVGGSTNLTPHPILRWPTRGQHRIGGVV